MEVKLNIPDWLKIPINVLLPTVCLASGTLLLLPDGWLEKFHLLDWCQENGFAIGLSFILSVCLLAVYLFFYLKKVLSVGIYNLTFKRKTMRRISKMNDAEIAIIANLYNSPGYTAMLDYNQPLTQGLLGRNYIYMGGQQQVTLDVFNNSIPAHFTLQPFVYQTLNHYRPKIEKEISRIEKKLSEEKNPTKKAALSDELRNITKSFNCMYKGGHF